MQRTSKTPAEAKGYALIAVLITGALVAAAVGAMILTTRHAGGAAIQDSQSADAYAAAVAGIAWASGNVSDQTGSEMVQNAANGTTQNFRGTNIFTWDGAALHGGAPSTVPAKGTSNGDWTAVGDGHYALLGALDAFNAGRTVLVRSVGRAGAAEVVLETNIVLNVLQSLPSGLISCFADDRQVTFYDQEGPYDYTGDFRIDGGLGVPWAMSAEHNRVNGLRRESGNTTLNAAYSFENRYVRSVQSLGTDPISPDASGNRLGGSGGSTDVLFVSSNLGPRTNWDNNPYTTNDPRIVDVLGDASGDDSFGRKSRGLSVGNGGGVYTSLISGGVGNGAIEVDPAAVMRATPIIAYKDADTDTPGGLLFNDQFDDGEARKGFYACDNHVNGSLLASTEGCIKGSSGASAPDYTDSAVNHSGRAWGFVQSAVRQCTGSGASIDATTGDPWYNAATNVNGIKCASGFEWLENLAACLVVPRNVATNAGTNGALAGFTDGNNNNNLNGCHPGCLVAADQDGDRRPERPFRSSCINLDPTVQTVYGPGAYAFDGLNVAGTPAVSPFINGGLLDGNNSTVPFTAIDNNAIPAGGNMGPYANNWRTFLLSNLGISTAGAEWDAPVLSIGTWVAQMGVPFSPRNLAASAMVGGFVVEFGNPSLITRLDMTDRGPLGTCEQNCLAYGFAVDRTYGAHNSGGAVGTPGTESHNCIATVPAPGGGTTSVHCNLDYDQDGALDRKTYALSSSYREECASPHDGIPYAPAFDVSSNNTNISGAGCDNAMPQFTGPSLNITAFCDDGGNQAIRDSVNQLLAAAVPITDSELKGAAGAVTDVDSGGSGWFGGAKCHMGGVTFDGAAHTHSGNISAVPTTDLNRLGHPDYWIENDCPNPGVWTVSSSANLTPNSTCGCGVLIFNNNTITFNSDTHFLWRGLVIWDLKNTSGGQMLEVKGSGHATFAVEGGLIINDPNSSGFEVKITKGVAQSSIVQDSASPQSIKQLYRLNQAAIDDAFNGIARPITTVRRIQ